MLITLHLVVPDLWLNQQLLSVISFLSLGAYFLLFISIDKMLGKQIFYQLDFRLQIPNWILMVEVCVEVNEITLFFQSITTLDIQ